MFSADELKKIKTLSTPFYYYDMEVLKNTLQEIKSAADNFKYVVHYALKANTNEPILKMIQQFGFGADCVSGNEIKRAVEVGFQSEQIAFAGVGKSDEEILIGLENNIFCFNCESIQEIEVINDFAEKNRKIASIALRINPNVNAHTHHYITTGLEENKFGINIWELDEVLAIIEKSSNIKLTGIHFHIGSQITDMSVFKSLCLKVNELQQWFEMRKIKLEHINVGGGLGVDYHEPDKNSMADFKTYFGIFNQFLEIRKGQKIHFELGRAMVAQSGNLISKVLYVKKGIAKNFIILDAGMTELIRPALYQSYHKIENISNVNEANQKYDVVGPICESSDCFGKAVSLPETKRGDFISLRTTGAYGEVMSSGYNLREKASAYYSDKIF
ncbi:MAG TPA: diaminopimelate decarboxylase [Bacteroidia bacterium]|nr:diaminopimelate decarboxylase [Bacteroidia bacterium]